MTRTLEISDIELDLAADSVIDRLPDPDYQTNFQPTYPDQEALWQAVREMRTIPAVTTPQNILALRHKTAELVEGANTGPYLTVGRCAEPINSNVSAETRALNSRVTESMAVLALGGGFIHVPRERGQYPKPRSAMLQKLPSGLRVVSYMGDSINDKEATEEARIPDPRRMVNGARQASEFETALTELTSGHVWASHEALLLAAEESHMYTDPESGDEYLLSADVPWIGERTRRLDGPHVAMLRRIVNPVGVKLGPSTTADDIEGLTSALNPDAAPGKLIYMVRVGGDQEALKRITGAIKELAPGSVILYDEHGSTTALDDGTKIRSVEGIISDTRLLAEACGEIGLRLHGVNLEVTTEDRMECVMKPGQRPLHEGGVDPQLNLNQMKLVLAGIRDCLPAAVRYGNDDIWSQAFANGL